MAVAKAFEMNKIARHEGLEMPKARELSERQ